MTGSAAIAGPAMSITAFATDFIDEGVEQALDNIQLRAGIDGVALAAVYHHARDIFPHNPSRRVRFLEGGRAFFMPDATRYAADGIRPVPSSLLDGGDPLAQLRRATRRRDMSLHAWVVFTHNSLLGSLHPEAATQNVYGDPLVTALCPTNPKVIDYCCAVARDVASHEVESVLAESLHFDILEHGYHHERYLIELGPVDRMLLGLCFCTHCRTVGIEYGVDVTGLSTSVRQRLDRCFETASAYDDTAADLPAVGELWDGELLGYLNARQSAVTTLAQGVHDALARTGVELAFIDPAGAMKGYTDGQPMGGPATDVSWRFGVDPVGLSDACDEIVAVAYAADPERVRVDLQSYQALISGRCRLRAALRPMVPDCRTPANLAEKLAIAHELGVARIDLYHYGLIRLEDLDVVSAAVRSGTTPSEPTR